MNIDYLAMDKNNKLYVAGFERARTTDDGGITWDSLVKTVGSYQKIIITDSNYIASNQYHIIGSMAGVYMSRQTDGNLTGGTGRIMGPNNSFFVNKKHNFFQKDLLNDVLTIKRTADYGTNLTTVFSDSNITSDGKAGMAENKTTQTMVLYFTKKKPSPTYADSSQIFRSTDNGVNWTRTYLFPGVSFFKDLICDKNGTFYAIMQDFSNGYVLKSTDDGLNWTIATIVTSELNNFDPGKLISSANSSLHYINKNANKSYVMSSTDDGINWTKSNVTIPSSPSYINDIVADGNNVLFIATNDGVFKYSSLTGVKESSRESFGFSLMPNPSTGKFSINFRGEAESHPVEICNLLGEKIWSANFTGISKSDIDLSGYPRGIYFVKLYNRDFIYLKKIIVQP